MTKISVIVPTRNNASTIRALLDSLSQQSVKDFEVIIVDSSDDSTPEIASKYPFVRLVRMEAKGANAARNLGLQLAEGDIIAFTDGDCRLPPNWLEKIVKFFESHPDAFAVGGSVDTASELKGYLIADYYNDALWPMMPLYSEESKITCETFHKIRVPNSNNLAFRRKVFAMGLKFDESFRGGYEEVELLWRMCKQRLSLYVSPEIVVEHFHTKSLKRMLKRALNYGKGHFWFFRKYPECPLALYGSLVIIGVLFMYFPLSLVLLALGYPHLLLLVPLTYIALTVCYKYKKKSIKRALLYPLIDIAFYFTFGIGFVLGLATFLRGFFTGKRV